MKSLKLIPARYHLDINKSFFIKAGYVSFIETEGSESKPKPSYVMERFSRNLMWLSNIFAGFARVIEQEAEKYNQSNSISPARTLVFPS